METIVLKGYGTNIAPYDAIELGTYDSYGIEQLQIIKGDGWEDLNVIATFNPPNKKPVQVVVDSVTNICDVPKEATANLYGTGSIVFVGLADGVQRISTDVEYIVKKHSNASGTEPAEPTPSIVQQILTEAQNANKTSADAKKLATDAKDIAQSVRDDADEGKFNGKDGAKGDKGDTGTTPQLKIGEDNLWHVSYDNGETWVSLGVKATGDTGAAGKDGVNGLTPRIGENGNWWIGDTDTGVLAKGLKGDTGDKGADGVSPTATVTQTDDGAEFTVTDVNGTTTAVVKNGADGKNGAPGANGISPTVQVKTIDGGHRVTFTDASDSHVVDVLDGKDAVVDETLTQSGQAADAKVTGEKIGQLQKRQNVLVGSETGNPVSCDDAFAAPLCGLNVYGKSTQDGTPTPDAPVPIVSAGDGGTIVVKMTGKNLLYIPDGKAIIRGVTITSKNGIISISGTATEDGYVYLPIKQISIHGLAFLSSNVSKATVKLVSKSWDVLFTQGRADNTQEVITCICFVVKKGTNYDLNGIYVQLELGSTATAYSPYREQLLTLSTPNGLPGIPVTSGGNYTDPQGQQWICDEVDLERGVKVQRVYKVDVDGENSKFKQAGDYANLLPRGLPNALYNVGQKTYAISTFTSLSWFFNTIDGQFLYLIAADISGQLNESCKKQLGKIYYALATPIETPLTPAEIAAYKALTAYAPDTVVQASDEAGIKLDYQRDVNLVVKNFEDAIASMTTT